MNMELPVLVIVTIVSLVFDLGKANRLLNFQTADEYVNICMDGVSHKSQPGPEADLFDKCKPWKDKSCCSEELSKQIHANKTWYKLDWSHCDTPLSPKCRGRFVKDLCFYECSPNVGPWLVKFSNRKDNKSNRKDMELNEVDGMKIRNERFIDVPLCHTECQAWFEDCQEDYTCTENWSRGFNWSSGLPACHEGSTCRTFKEVYGNATKFCETVWDHSWKVVPDNDPNGCMITWWNEGVPNPNYDVAYRKATQVVGGSCQLVPPSLLLVLLASLSVVLFSKNVSRS